MTRLKARLLTFARGELKLAPLDKSADTVTIQVTPETRYVGAAAAGFGDIKVGDYAGAAVTLRGRTLRAQNVYLYDPALRGSGEGRFTDGDRLLINGAVSAVRPAAAEDAHDGTMTLHYHGAVLTNGAKGAPPLCEGRATPAPYASPLACVGDAAIEVLPGTPVQALTVGDAGLLVPGATVTVSMVKMADGKTIAPGVIVEKPPAKPAAPGDSETVEKPQSPQ